MAIRFKPDQDLKVSLSYFVKQNNIQAGFILTAVGNLKQTTLRFTDRNNAQVFKEEFEIVSLVQRGRNNPPVKKGSKAYCKSFLTFCLLALVGTLSIHGLYLHLSLSDKNSKTIGGHLVEGCIIYTTAKIVIAKSEEFVFLRTVDETTGYKELEIHPPIERA